MHGVKPNATKYKRSCSHLDRQNAMSIDPVWNETVIEWNTHLRLAKVPDDTLYQLLCTRRRKVQILLSSFEQLQRSHGCLNCQRLALFLFLRYCSKADDLLSHERFRQVTLGKVFYAADHNVFVGHLFGIEQPSQTSLQDLLGFCCCACQVEGEEGAA